jgi:hypothetical protein
MLDVEARFPHGDDSRFDRNDVAEACGLMEARPGLDQRNACEIEPSQEIALRQAGSLENERGLGVEPLKEPRVEDDARGVTIAPLDLPLPSRNDHRLSSTHTSRAAPRQRRPTARPSPLNDFHHASWCR